jgi:hypothetical protein
MQNGKKREQGHRPLNWPVTLSVYGNATQSREDLEVGSFIPDPGVKVAERIGSSAAGQLGDGND